MNLFDETFHIVMDKVSPSNSKSTAYKRALAVQLLLLAVHQLPRYVREAQRARG